MPLELQDIFAGERGGRFEIQGKPFIDGPAQASKKRA